MNAPLEFPEGKYAKVEMMGHRTLWGRISEVEIAGGKMLKVEPIVGGKIVGETLINSASLYALTPCSAAKAFAGAPQSHVYDDTLRLLAGPSSPGTVDLERDRGDEYGGACEVCDGDGCSECEGDDEQTHEIARCDPDESIEPCVTCGSGIVNGVGCQRTDCPHPTPKDADTADLFAPTQPPACEPTPAPYNPALEVCDCGHFRERHSADGTCPCRYDGCDCGQFKMEMPF